MGNLTTKNGIAPSGTKYYLVNDSTYIWGTPTGAYGKIFYRKNKPSEYYWYDSVGDRFLTEDPDVKKGHDNNILYLKQNKMFISPLDNIKNWVKSFITPKGLLTDDETSEPIEMKTGGTIRCAECGAKMKKKKKYIK